MAFGVESLTQIMADHRGEKTSWGRWAGSIIIADVLAIWSKTCLDKHDMVPMDLGSMSLIVGVFLINAVKSVYETKPPAVSPPPESK